MVGCQDTLVTVGSKKILHISSLFLMPDCTSTSIYFIKEILVPKKFHKEHPPTRPHKDAFFQCSLSHMLVSQPHRDSPPSYPQLKVALTLPDALICYHQAYHLPVYLNILISATFFNMFLIRFYDPLKVLYVHIFSQKHFATTII